MIEVSTNWCKPQTRTRQKKICSNIEWQPCTHCSLCATDMNVMNVVSISFFCKIAVMPLLRIEHWRQSHVTRQPLGVRHQFQIMTFKVAHGIWLRYQKNSIKLYNCCTDPIQLAGVICRISSRLCLHKSIFYYPHTQTYPKTTDKSKLEMKMTAIKMHNTIAGCFCRSSANWFHFYCRIVCLWMCSINFSAFPFFSFLLFILSITFRFFSFFIFHTTCRRA